MRLQHRLRAASRSPAPSISASNSSKRESSPIHQVLNQISEALNALYGHKGTVPRINLGPCGSVAQIFHACWNEKFSNQATVCFILVPGSDTCAHIFIKLPDGNYFDGGYGVITPADVQARIDGRALIEEMTVYDAHELEKQSGGLDRQYPNCATYNARKVRSVVESFLGACPADEA